MQTWGNELNKIADEKKTKTLLKTGRSATSHTGKKKEKSHWYLLGSKEQQQKIGMKKSIILGLLIEQLLKWRMIIAVNFPIGKFTAMIILHFNNCSINKPSIIDFFIPIFCCCSLLPRRYQWLFSFFFPVWEVADLPVLSNVFVFFSSAILFSSFPQVCIHLCINNSETRRSNSPQISDDHWKLLFRAWRNISYTRDSVS